MGKDPRFNFYVDNWIGGTEGFTLEQEGAYLALVIMQSKVGRFTADQAIDKLLQKTRGNAAASAGLWNFLMPKFETDGKLFWSGRLEKEMNKSRLHSEKQSDRAKKRWEEKTNHAAAYPCTQALPDNGSGNGNSIGIDLKLKESLDEIYIDQQRGKWKHINFEQELTSFQEKVRGSPGRYQHRDTDGIRLAFQSQLRNAKPIKHFNGKQPNSIVEERKKQYEKGT